MDNVDKRLSCRIFKQAFWMFFALVGLQANAAPFAYVSNTDAGTISVIDEGNNYSVSQVISTFDTPFSLALSTDAKHLYAPVATGLTDVNLTAGTRTTYGNAKGWASAVHPGGNYVYWVDDSNQLWTLNRLTNTASISSSPVDIASAGVPWGLMLNASGTRLYAFSYSHNYVTVFDVANGIPGIAPIATIAVSAGGSGTAPQALSPDGTKLYVALTDTATNGGVKVIDTTTNTIVGGSGYTYTAGAAVYSVGLNPTGTKLYAVNFYAGSVTVFDVVTHAAIKSISVGDRPYSISVNPTTGIAYVPNYGGGTVSVIDTNQDAVVATVAVVGSPRYVAISPLPRTPSGLQATAGNTQASFTFNAPIGTVSAYNVSCSNGGGTPVTATGSASPITLLGLTNGATYQCTVAATNGYGTGGASSAVSVTPFTTPGAPVILNASIENGQTTLSFNPPASTGGATITGYTAACSGGGSTLTKSGSSSPLMVTGMTNGTAYSCSVTANNNAGNGVASSPVVVVPATTPGAPAVVSITPGNAQASITFTPPSSNGGSAITSYLAACTNQGVAKTASATASPITISGLTNGAIYFCSVTASNIVGLGTASTGASVTPVDPNAGADSFFNYAEDHYPQYFYGFNHTIQSQWFLTYYYRHYSDGAVLAVNNGTVYVMSPGFGNALLSLGSLSSLMTSLGIAP